MSDLLDYRTLFLAAGIVSGALLMLLAMQPRIPYPGFVRVVVGLDVLAAAILISGLRGYVPDALWILEVIALGSFALIDSGIRLFCAMPRRGRWPYVYVLAAMLLLTYLFFTRPLQPRIVVTSLLLIPIFIDAALPLLKTPPKGRQFGYHCVATVFMLFCVAACVRVAGVASLGANDSPYFAKSPANTSFFLLVMFLLLALAFGLIALTHERLVAELKAAHEYAVEEGRERVRVERQLAQAERLAAVGSLAGGVAHFFNNQMCTIQLACSVLRQSLSTTGSPVVSFVEKIDKASRHSSYITMRLQQYAQSKALRASRFNPSRLLDEILPEIQTSAGESIKVTTSKSSTIPDVELDADMLKETVFALVRNARDAMPAGGKLTISLGEAELDSPHAKQFSLPSGVFVLLSLADTGSGMDDETLRHTFEPFFTTKGLANAEGLSLASAYGSIRQSGGTITASSTPNHGSTFNLYLPAARSAQERELAA